MLVSLFFLKQKMSVSRGNGIGYSTYRAAGAGARVAVAVAAGAGAGRHLGWLVDVCLKKDNRKDSLVWSRQRSVGSSKP